MYCREVAVERTKRIPSLKKGGEMRFLLSQLYKRWFKGFWMEVFQG
jgi:hypothetical protein